MSPDRSSYLNPIAVPTPTQSDELPSTDLTPEPKFYIFVRPVKVRPSWLSYFVCWRVPLHKPQVSRRTIGSNVSGLLIHYHPSTPSLKSGKLDYG